MTQVVTFTLDEITCLLEEDNPSTPYLWTAFVWISETPASVGVLTPSEINDRVVLRSNLQPGESAPIPASVGVATQSFDDLTKAAFIQVALLWQKHGTPGSVVQAGFNAFGKHLKSAIIANLDGLESNPQARQQAISNIQAAVYEAIYQAIHGSLSDAEKTEIELGILTLDAQIGSGEQPIMDLQSQPFTIYLGEPYDGRLLFFLYGNENGTGSVSASSVIGDSGWNAFKFLFSGGNGIIYAVDPEGDLLFYRDYNQDGTGNVADPSVIGHGGWADFKFLFSGGNGIIYAVDGGGDLLFYRDHNQDGTGNVAHPSVIGHGGWADFKFVFSGGNGIIYAVNHRGELLFYRDHNQDGTGNVADPSIIGTGFGVYKFLFSGGGKGIIYAAEVGPTHYYQISGNFEITTS